MSLTDKPSNTVESMEKDTDYNGGESTTNLTDAQRARVERNRQKALLLRQSRLVKRPIEKELPCVQQTKLPKVIDTDGGFLIEEEEEEDLAVKLVHEPAAYIGSALVCLECSKDFMDSYLHTNFNFNVCNQCRDPDEKHRLITKTEAKASYLLRDADFDKREPELKFIIKKNPHKKFGDMKLYLEAQVKSRSLEIWGDEEKIQEEMERREANREVSKQKRFDKKVKELRKNVRSSLYKKDFGPHEHTYGPETYDEAEDMYSKTCQTCSHVMSYEKM